MPEASRYVAAHERDAPRLILGPASSEELVESIRFSDYPQPNQPVDILHVRVDAAMIRMSGAGPLTLWIQKVFGTVPPADMSVSLNCLEGAEGREQATRALGERPNRAAAV
jgi:hypothetical protein